MPPMVIIANCFLGGVLKNVVFNVKRLDISQLARLTRIQRMTELSSL